MANGLVEHRNFSPAVLTAMASNPEWVAREIAAHRELCPPQTLAKLARDEDLSIRAVVAARWDCPLQMLAALAASTGRHVQLAVARNPNCDDDAAEELARSLDSTDPATADEALRAMAHNLSPAARRAVARHGLCPKQVLAWLTANDDTEQTRAAAAGNPNSSPRLVAVLAQDDARAVRDAAATTMRTLGLRLQSHHSG